MQNTTPAAFPDTRVLIVGTSLNPDSKSRVLAKIAAERLGTRGVKAELLDLRDFNLPLVGDGASDHNADVERIKAAFERATHIILAVPIYNGDVNAGARNLANLGCNFNQKTVGFLCAAGGQRSYMGIFAFANSLMFEFESWIVPRHVYAVYNDFGADGTLANHEILQRIDSLLDGLLSRAPSRRAEFQTAS